ncbi:GntR family transcriptional regulator [Brachybacterium vulturis]|uniref:GntR family transcriptional regulator n=1 Tax=Brachybacterium vulturis TaxID=2017484 RepID=A0A291GLI9_9MICO|nr:GntR family transcriptional regulator [Brachybacterium vulturis]ATG50940.1 GntR family transcriptional regulator [Brachybacterium vulturis]
MATRALSERATAPTVSKSQQAYDWLRERILRQEFTPGYRLVLSAIGKELGMSVVPVREAVRRLEAEGLVVFERNIGARVGMIDRTGYEEAMDALAVLESAAISRAAAHLDAATLRRARELNEVMRGSLEHFDAHMFTALNQQFHALLYRACPNQHLVDLTEAEWSRLGHLRDSTFTFIPGRAPESVREHEHILGLIEAGAAPDGVEHACRMHRGRTLSAYLDLGEPGAPTSPSTP